MKCRQCNTELPIAEDQTDEIDDDELVLDSAGIGPCPNYYTCGKCMAEFKGE